MTAKFAPVVLSNEHPSFLLLKKMIPHIDAVWVDALVARITRTVPGTAWMDPNFQYHLYINPVTPKDIADLRHAFIKVVAALGYRGPLFSHPFEHDGLVYAQTFPVVDLFTLTGVTIWMRNIKTPSPEVDQMVVQLVDMMKRNPGLGRMFPYHVDGTTRGNVMKMMDFAGIITL